MHESIIVQVTSSIQVQKMQKTYQESNAVYIDEEPNGAAYLT